MWKLRSFRAVSDSPAPLPMAGKMPPAPDLSPDDIDLIHRLWLELTEALPRAELRHGDVVTLALQDLQRQFEGPERDGILDGVRRKHARQSEGQNGSAMLGSGTTALRIDTPSLKPFIRGSKQARRIPGNAPSLRRTGDRRRRSLVLSFWGAVLSFCIPIVLLIGAIWNPSGIEGDVVMASLAALVLARLGIALVKRGAIGRQEQPWPTDTRSEHAAAWKSDKSLQSQHAR